MEILQWGQDSKGLARPSPADSRMMVVLFKTELRREAATDPLH